MTHISHNAFDRQSITRHTFRAGNLTCDYCGTQRQRLFKYGITPDDSLAGRTNWTRGAFCSIDCWRNYHN